MITSSSSETQLSSILWSEIRHLISTAAYPLPFRVTSLRVEKLKDPQTGETEPRDYIIGHVTNEVENFQGHHLPNDKPRVLGVFDEASGVPDAFYDASSSWAHRTLVIGNPLSTTNFFYRNCRAGDVPDPAGTAKLLRKVIHIDGRDSPNVRAGMRWRENGNAGPSPVLIPGLLNYDEYIRREATWDEVKKTTRLYGRFYEGDQALLFPMHWLDAAMHRDRWAEVIRRARTVEAIGVDVAAGGRDDTCWTLVDHVGVIEQIVLDLANTMEIVGRTVRLIQQRNLPPERVAVDAGGGGKQIADRLHEQGYFVRAIGFGESPMPTKRSQNERPSYMATCVGSRSRTRERRFSASASGGRTASGAGRAPAAVRQRGPHVPAPEGTPHKPSSPHDFAPRTAGPQPGSGGFPGAGSLGPPAAVRVLGPAPA